MSISNLKRIFLRPEIWIVLFFLIRLIGITNPPLEHVHNSRQITGLMVARNFYEVDANIMYPRIDANHGQSGIVGMEFPSMNYLHFLLAEIFGYTHWYGRLINLIISSLGILFFVKLLRLAKFDERHVLASTLFLICSIWFSFSRKMMPDTYCISLMFIAMYFAWKFLDDEKWYFVLLYVLFSSLAVLSKIPAGMFFVLIIPAICNKKFSLGSKIALCTSTIIPLVLTYLWYFVWNEHLVDLYGNWYNIGKTFSQGFSEVSHNIVATLDNFYFDAFSGYFVFALSVAGLVIAIVKKDVEMITIFILPFIMFVIYIFKSGKFFFDQNYYIIPFVPVMAILAGYATNLVKKKWLFALIILLGMAEGIANQQHDFFIRQTDEYKLSLETIMDEISDTDDLIAINSGANQQLLYLSHRKGWSCFNDSMTSRNIMKWIKTQNCKYFVFDKHNFEYSNQFDFAPVFENEDFLIFRLDDCNK